MLQGRVSSQEKLSNTKWISCIICVCVCVVGRSIAFFGRVFLYFFVLLDFVCLFLEFFLEKKNMNFGK